MVIKIRNRLQGKEEWLERNTKELPGVGWNVLYLSKQVVTWCKQLSKLIKQNVLRPVHFTVC